MLPNPKNMSLPMDLSKQLVSECQGSKMIAKRLTADGIPVSYKTIQRLFHKDGSRNEQRFIVGKSTNVLNQAPRG
jgi:hypothetical protein